jgi:uncharacterized protein YjaZ
MEGICAIGRIRAGGPWIGFQPSAQGYRVLAGSSSLVRGREASADEMLAMAIAYFEEAFDDAPQELEASHEDLSALVRHLCAGRLDPKDRRLLDEAVDAIDDGLPGDAVANRLTAARGHAADEQADPVDLLVTLAEELLRD